MGLATSIGSQDKDASGNSLSGYMKNTFNRLRIWDSRSKSKGNDSNLRQAFVLLDTMKSQLYLPDNVVEETAYIYRKAAALKLTRGRGISSILYAALYAACRKTATPRTLRDIAKSGNIRKGDLATAYRIMVKNLDLKLEPYDPVEFVTKVCSMIYVSENTRRNALNLLLKAEDVGFSIGKNPMSLVAAAVYLATCATNEKKTQVEIARVCGISNVSVRNLTKLFKVKLGLLIEE
jgi:transcription initiation factor TFIIB